MPTLAQRLIDLANAVGADIKTLTNRQGDLTALQTTAKTNLVAALNELKTLVGSGGMSGGAPIDDAATSGAAVVYSVDKVLALIDAAKTGVKGELTNGAAAALDTLNELAAALGNDPSFAATVATALAARVRFDAAQTLTAGQKTQACENRGIGEPDTDLVATYTAAKA